MSDAKPFEPVDIYDYGDFDMDGQRFVFNPPLRLRQPDGTIREIKVIHFNQWLVLGPGVTKEDVIHALIRAERVETA